MALHAAKRIALYVMMPLIIGTLLYVLFRDRDIPIVSALPHSAEPIRTRGAVAIALGSLPDLAWAWSFGGAVGLVWRAQPLQRSVPWMLAGLCAAAFMEIGQWPRIGMISGTFDVLDLVAICFGYVIGAALALRSGDPKVSTDSA